MYEWLIIHNNMLMIVILIAFVIGVYYINRRMKEIKKRKLSEYYKRIKKHEDEWRRMVYGKDLDGFDDNFKW